MVENDYTVISLAEYRQLIVSNVERGNVEKQLREMKFRCDSLQSKAYFKMMDKIEKNENRKDKEVE